MTLPASRSPSTAIPRVAEDLRAQVRAQQLDMSMRLASFTIAVAFSVVQVVVTVFWAAHSRIYLGLLEALVLTLSVVGVQECWRWSRRPLPTEIDPRVVPSVIGFALIFGCALGSIPILLFPEGDPAERTLIASTCAGLIATGLSLAVTPKIAASFSGPIVFGSFVGLWLKGETYDVYIAILLLFYAAFLMILSMHFSRLVAARVAAQADLQRQQELTSLLLYDFEEGASDWLWETDEKLQLQHVSPRLLEIAGMPLAALQQMPIDRLFNVEAKPDEPNAGPELRELIAERRTFRGLLVCVARGQDLRWWSLSGKPIFDRDGLFAGYRGVGSDVTDKKRSEDQLSYLAMNDSLTGLPNRASFQIELRESTVAFDGGQDFCLLFLDIDGFKGINDTFGHATGDRLLQAAAKRLRDLSEIHGAWLARLAGDEFVMILRGRGNGAKKEIAGIAGDLVAAMGNPFQLGDVRLNVGVSIGLAIASDGGAAEITRHADMALYRVKQDGRGHFRFYEAEMDKGFDARRTLMTDLRGALGRGEFFLDFQPLVSAIDSRVQGFEALLRWRHPVRGLVPPGEFIALAEESGVIFSLGEWIVRQACRVAAQWPSDIQIAVNLSPVQLRHSNFPLIVSLALQESGLAPARLELEVTESLFLDISQVTQSNLDELRRLGVKLSLDDFGTGYSSLNYLRRIPFHKIKIDQSFVREVPNVASDLAIIRSVIEIAATLGMTVTAEGVETDTQQMCLQGYGCDQLQGYLFSKPLSVADAARFISDTRRRAKTAQAA